MPNQPEPRLTPYLMVQGGLKALDFYTRAFGAEEVDRYMDQDGQRLGHAALRINGAFIYISDEFLEFEFVKTRSPSTLGGTTVSITLHVDDSDAWFERAVAAGAEVVRPISNQFYGRSASVRDPFGHLWGILSPIEEQAA